MPAESAAKRRHLMWASAVLLISLLALLPSISFVVGPSSASAVRSCYSAVGVSSGREPEPCRWPLTLSPPPGYQWDASANSSTGALISRTVGAFRSVVGLTSESDSVFGVNAYSIQLNTNVFNTTTVYTDGRSAVGWLQFTFENPGGNNSAQYGFVSIEYWLLGYQSAYGSCPISPLPDGGSWAVYKGSCTAFSRDDITPWEAPTKLGSLSLKGFANATTDEGVLCVAKGSCYSSSLPDQVLDLHDHWLISEFNVFGAGLGSVAKFNPGTLITVEDSLNVVPSCVQWGRTGERNNLNITNCTSDGVGQVFFTETNNLVSQPIRFSVARGPATSVLLTGCSVSPTKVAANGGAQTVYAAPNCAMTVHLTGGTASRYVSPTGSATLSLKTCSSLTCPTISRTIYEEFRVAFLAKPIGHGKVAVDGRAGITSGWYYSGHTIALKAMDSSPYHFIRWSSNTKAVRISGATRAMVDAIIDGPGTVTATFS